MVEVFYGLDSYLRWAQFGTLCFKDDGSKPEAVFDLLPPRYVTVARHV